jgi:EAL domain-containing protein (putative c-di-GMP-specific phosphodiesterase class I)
VDTEAQAFALRRQGVTLVQGLLTGAPMDAAALLGADPETEARALAR